MSPLRIGMIGFGAMAQQLSELVSENAPHIQVVGVLTREEPSARAPGGVTREPMFLPTLDDLLTLRPQLVVECAGHQALGNYGPIVLSSGTDLLVASVGALADASVEAALLASARAGQAVLRIPAGALGGLDVLAAARLAGAMSVVYTSKKGVRAWRGTAAEQMIDLDTVKGPTTFFEGNARSAATAFPQNANVAAAVALAGAGFDKTSVHLMVDPGADGNRHDIHAWGEFGEIRVSVKGNTLPANPKTSILAAYSLFRSLTNLSSNIVVG